MTTDRKDASPPGNPSTTPSRGGSSGATPSTSTPSRPNKESRLKAANSEACSLRKSAGDADGDAASAPPVICRPARFRSAATLEASFRRGLEKRKTIGLLGTAVSDHPELIPLCRSILEKGGSVAVGSLRLDRLSGSMAALLKETGVETLSLAPEAGSQRLRDLIRKGITEAEIFSAVDNLLDYDMVCLRLYFMVGLPTETDEDVEAIIRLVKAMEHRARHLRREEKSFGV